ncbi:hypothetical protein K2F43_06030 [Clostridium estertheticum]|uniref:hypothetical protein n=1 Tax=Clostridium estertheticum TaxID=238834 RepID=UPI001C6F25EA|nr:hypothetical protein [Clostridium estertheticum]MBW9170764.1 hypothetical protein [Clostridium estertheticum]WLC74397.1 hypothetical protein KTC99_16725 [Clostridium estertheticum]
MSWTRKKKLSDYQKAISEFNSDMKSTKTTEQYDNINKIYKQIKKYYEAKRINEDFDMNIEKIRIQRNLGVHPNNFMSFGIACYIAIIGTIFYFMIQITISYLDKYGNEIIKFGISLFFLVLLFKTISSTFGKEIIKDKPRNLMMNISIKVLDDIEKEVAEEVDRLEKQQRIEQYISREKFINNFATFSEIAVKLSNVFKKK